MFLGFQEMHFKNWTKHQVLLSVVKCTNDMLVRSLIPSIEYHDYTSTSDGIDGNILLSQTHPPRWTKSRLCHYVVEMQITKFSIIMQWCRCTLHTWWMGEIIQSIGWCRRHTWTKAWKVNCAETAHEESSVSFFAHSSIVTCDRWKLFRTYR